MTDPVQEILDVIWLYGTPETRPNSLIEAFDQLHGHSGHDLSQAFVLALASDNHSVVIRGLDLLAEYFRALPDVLPSVRKLVAEGSVWQQTRAIDVLVAYSDRSPEATKAVQSLFYTSEDYMQLTAAGYLALCHDCPGAVRYLQEIVESKAPDAFVAKSYLSKWGYPVREVQKHEYPALQRMLRRYGAAEADLVEELRNLGAIDLELVATRGERIVGHIVLISLRLETRPAVPRATFIPYLFVEPACRNQEIGMRLVMDALRHCDIVQWRFVFTFAWNEYLNRFNFGSAEGITADPPGADLTVMCLDSRTLENVRGRAILPESVRRYLARTRENDDPSIFQ
jgi:predicted N-acetyltransferase YhbS